LFPGSNTPTPSAKRKAGPQWPTDEVVGVLFHGQGWGLTEQGLLVRVDRSVSVSAVEAEAEAAFTLG